MNDSLAEASSTLEELGQVLMPVLRTEPVDELVGQLFPDRLALEHAVHLITTLSDPGAQHEILLMQDWNSEAYEAWLGKYGKPLPRLRDPVDPALEPYLPVNCPHGSPSPELYGTGEVRRERLAKATVKTKDSDDEDSTSSSSSESEESDEPGMFLS